jgi:hypothetical protein
MQSRALKSSSRSNAHQHITPRETHLDGDGVLVFLAAHVHDDSSCSLGSSGGSFGGTWEQQQ